MWLIAAALVAIIFVGIMAGRSLLKACRHYRALDKAWQHRREIARLAGRLEGDSNAPYEVRSIARYVADHAFDVGELRSAFLYKPASSDSRPNFGKTLRTSFGTKYGDDVEKLMRAFAYVVLHENGRMTSFLRGEFRPLPPSILSAGSSGHALRRAVRDGLPMKEEAKRRAPDVWEAVRSNWQRESMAAE